MPPSPPQMSATDYNDIAPAYLSSYHIIPCCGSILCVRHYNSHVHPLLLQERIFVSVYGVYTVRFTGKDNSNIRLTARDCTYSSHTDATNGDKPPAVILYRSAWVFGRSPMPFNFDSLNPEFKTTRLCSGQRSGEIGRPSSLHGCLRITLQEMHLRMQAHLWLA